MSKMIANLDNQKLADKSSMDDSTSSISLPGCCRYNLRNRGPPMFAALAEKECPICLSDVFEKPVVVNCGHTFCHQCIQSAMVKHKSCPICNQLLIESLFLSDTSYTRKLTRKNRSPVRAKIQQVANGSATLSVGTKAPKESQPPSRRGKDSAKSKKLRRTCI